MLGRFCSYVFHPPPHCLHILFILDERRDGTLLGDKFPHSYADFHEDVTQIRLTLDAFGIRSHHSLKTSRLAITRFTLFSFELRTCASK